MVWFSVYSFGLILLCYYVISLSNDNLILQGAIQAKYGMWISTIVFIPITAYLVYQVSTDRVVTNLDYIFAKTKENIVKFFAFLRRKRKH